MRAIALAMLMVLGLASVADAGTRGGRGATQPSPSHPSASKTSASPKTGASPKPRQVRGRIKKNKTHIAQHRKAKAGHTKRHHSTKSHAAPHAAKAGTERATH